MKFFMEIILYEFESSRSTRCRWTFKELGLEYKLIEDKSLFRSDELRKTHSLGKLPAAIIDGKALFESAAICTYVADQINEIDLIAKPGSRARAKHD